MGKRFDEAMEKLGAAYGEIDNFHAEQQTVLDEAAAAWNADVISIGRVLRSHLYVEYYLNRYLEQKLGISLSLINEQSFHSKAKMLQARSLDFKYLHRSILRINRVRNKMSHNLNAMVDKKDADYFKSVESFKPYLFILSASVDVDDVVKIYELYCQFVAQQFMEALNPKQPLIENVLHAMTKDVVAIYRGESID